MKDGNEIDFKKLSEPFDECDIEWRIQSSGLKGGKPWGMCLAYITNRAIMDRLDEVCGPANWKNEFIPAPLGGVICKISIKCGGEWVTKEDGADNTDIEAIKGGLSSAQKRAAVQWGIGRYLYKLDVGWATFDSNGKNSAKIEGKYFKWTPPSMASLPKQQSKTPQPQKPKLDIFAGLKEQLEKCKSFDEIIAITDSDRFKNWNNKLGTDNQSRASVLVADYQERFVKLIFHGWVTARYIER